MYAAASLLVASPFLCLMNINLYETIFKGTFPANILLTALIIILATKSLFPNIWSINIVKHFVYGLTIGIAAVNFLLIYFILSYGKAGYHGVMAFQYHIILFRDQFIQTFNIGLIGTICIYLSITAIYFAFNTSILSNYIYIKNMITITTIALFSASSFYTVARYSGDEHLRNILIIEKTTLDENYELHSKQVAYGLILDVLNENKIFVEEYIKNESKTLQNASDMDNQELRIFSAAFPYIKSKLEINHKEREQIEKTKSLPKKGWLTVESIQNEIHQLNVMIDRIKIINSNKNRIFTSFMSDVLSLYIPINNKNLISSLSRELLSEAAQISSERILLQEKQHNNRIKLNYSEYNEHKNRTSTCNKAIRNSITKERIQHGNILKRQLAKDISPRNLQPKASPRIKIR